MIRPLATALIEFILAFLVFKYGKVHKNVFSAVLFFLAAYQLGEVVIFATGGNEIGFKIAYVSTTLLPPLGVLLLERITKKFLGYPFFQLLGIGFALYILYIPAVALHWELGPFCVRIFTYDAILANFWTYYYQGTLFYSIGLMLWGIWRSKSTEVQSLLRNVLIGYLSFDGLTFLITYFVPSLQFSTASLMCALALIAAFIFARISLAENFAVLSDRAQKFKLPHLGW